MTTGAYVRSMKNWWLRDPFFKAYMVREATAVFVAAYALVLLVGLVRLAQGEVAWNQWLAALKSPTSLLFHTLLLAAFVYHTWSWFRIMPKPMPLIFVGGQPVPPAAITGARLAASALASSPPLLQGVDGAASGTLRTPGPFGQGSAVNGQIFRIVEAPVPVITQQPVSQTILPGGSVTFTVVATGATSYQWQRNGTSVSGATSASLSLTDVQPSNAGLYTAVITSGTTSTTPAVVVGATPPAKVAGTGQEVG